MNFNTTDLLATPLDSTSAGLFCLTFGKYRGQLLKHVASTYHGFSYLKWLADSSDTDASQAAKIVVNEMVPPPLEISEVAEMKLRFGRFRGKTWQDAVEEGGVAYIRSLARWEGLSEDNKAICDCILAEFKRQTA